MAKSAPEDKRKRMVAVVRLLHPVEVKGQTRTADRDAVVAQAAAVLVERCASCHGAREPAAGVRVDTPGLLGLL